MTRKLVAEKTAAAVGETTEKGTVPIIVATPGWGSSGWYGAPVLENAVKAKVFAQGLHLYLDHPGESERFDRPERSVRDLVGTLTENATWEPGSGIVAEAKIFGPYRDLFRDEGFVSAIGVSLRATADTTVGEAEGRKGTIITELIEAESVDFVTKAGRGGRVMAAMESARATAREASTEDTRDRLQRAVHDVHGDDWAYVMDFDPERSVVWHETGDGMVEQSYELTANAAALIGDPVPVRRVVTYPRVTSDAPTDATEASPQSPVAPAGSTTPTHESEEDTMPNIEEGRLAQLEADAGRVHEAEQARDQADTRATEAEARAMAAENREAARTVIRDADHAFTALEERGLLAGLPTGDDGTLDREAFTAAVTEAATEANAGQTSGVRGFGQSTESTREPVTEASLDNVLGITRKGA